MIMLIAFLVIGIFADGASVTTYAKSGKTKVTKKSITLYKGKSKKIKLKSFKKAKSVKIKNNGKSVVSVKRKAGAIVIKSKRLGKATITVNYKVKKKKYQYKIKVKVKRGGANSSGSNGSSSTGTSSKTSKKKGKTKYSYDVRVISQGTIYSDAMVYVKTDNPDGSFHFEKEDCIVSTAPKSYTNISFIDKKTYSVPGGYLVNVILDESSDNVLELYENKKGTFGIYTGIRVKIQTGCFDKEEQVWIQQMYERASGYVKQGYYTSPNGSKMTLPVEDIGEKHCMMRAMEAMVLDDFKYLKTTYDQDGEYVVVSEFGVSDQPYWKTMRVTCLLTTRIMRKFADKLGLPNEDTYAGYGDHHYATVIIDGEKVIFDASPSSKASLVEYGSWKMLDVTQLPNNSNAVIIKD